MKPEATRLPTFGSGVIQVWRRNFLQFRKSWLSNFFWMVLEPVLILLAIGYGVGSFISNIHGITYVDFFFPSLLCMTSMAVAFFEASYGNYSKLANQKTYSTMLLSPLDSRQIVIGEILWGATKGTMSAFTVAFVAGAFGQFDRWMLLPATAVIFLSSFLFAAFGMVITSRARSYESIIYPTSGLIIPMSLFSGTYFPLDQMPWGLQYVSYISPLTHSVALVRGFLIGGFMEWWQYLTHVVVLLALSVVFTKYAVDRIQERLKN